MKVKLLTMFTLVILIVGCAPRLMPGEHVVVEQSNKKPKWVKDERESFRENGYIYYRGRFTGASSVDGGIRDAAFNAQNDLTSSIARRFYSEYTVGRQLRQEEMRAIDDVAQALSKITLKGAIIDKRWWEKYKIIPYHGGKVKYGYNVYVLLKISEADFRESMETAFKQFEEDPKYKAIENIMNEFKKDIEDGTFQKKLR